MEETEVRLVEELLEVCRDYCDITWNKALTIIGVPADSVWRLSENICYHPEIRKVPDAPSPPTPTPESSEQPLAIPDALALLEISKGSNQADDQGQRVEGERQGQR